MCYVEADVDGVAEGFDVVVGSALSVEGGEAVFSTAVIVSQHPAKEPSHSPSVRHEGQEFRPALSQWSTHSLWNA